MEHVHTFFGRFFGVLFAQLRIFLIYNLFSPIGSIFFKGESASSFWGFLYVIFLRLTWTHEATKELQNLKPGRERPQKSGTRGVFFLFSQEKRFLFLVFVNKL